MLDEDSLNIQEEMAEKLGVSQRTISKRLKAIDMIQREENWVPYVVKSSQKWSKSS